MRVVRILLTLVACYAAHAQAQSVRVTLVPAGAEPSAEAAAEAVAGRPVTLAAQVVNEGSETIHLAESLTLPAGWQPLVADEAFEVAPGARVVRLVTVVTPRGAEAARHALRYNLLEAAGGGMGRLLASAEVEIALRAVYRLRLTGERSSAYTVAGEVYAPSFLLDNEGNAATSVRVSYRISGEGAAGRTQDTVVTIGPGRQEALALRIPTREGLGRQAEVTVPRPR